MKIKYAAIVTAAAFAVALGSFGWTPFSFGW